jgi:hypothetical protein
MMYTPLTRMVFGYADSHVLYAAVRLGIPDALSGGPVPVEKLAREVDCDPDRLTRLVRALAVLGVVDEAASGEVSLTTLGLPLCTGHPESLRSAVLLGGDPAMGRAWASLADAVRHGGSAFAHAHGRPLFEHLADDPPLTDVFNTAMGNGTGRVAAELARTYDLPAAGVVVDVGGGNGTLLAAVLAAAPGVHGVLFDSAAGAAGAAETLRRVARPECWSIRHGDFFATVPQGDLMLLKGILHDWDDRQCVDILRNCRRSITPDGRLLVLEPVLPPRPGPSAAAVVLSDIAMLVQTGGRERTAAAFRDLLRAADFTLSGVSARLAGTPTRILTAIPS